ncbi:hypothetical protein L7F22_021007 [Adiantum nelumboides]|nr:hypothetical protein [Adiantum nelumboides]
MESHYKGEPKSEDLETPLLLKKLQDIAVDFALLHWSSQFPSSLIAISRSLLDMRLDFCPISAPDCTLHCKSALRHLAQQSANVRRSSLWVHNVFQQPILISCTLLAAIHPTCPQTLSNCKQQQQCIASIDSTIGRPTSICGPQPVLCAC